MSRNIFVSINGKILPPNQDPNSGLIPVFDRSYLYGDSLYEVARSYNGQLRFVGEHLDRLEASARLCHLTLGQPLAEYARAMHETTAAYHAAERARGAPAPSEVYCRLVVSRGTGKIGFGLSNLETPTTYTVITQPLNEPTPEQWEKGAHYTIVSRLRNDPRALDPAMKSGNYLNCLLAFLEAQDAGCEDALLCNSEGHLTEGTTFNLFYIRRGIVATAPLDIGILDGITRRTTITIARELNLPVREVRFTPQNLMDADEIFITSTTKEVFPVTRISHQPVGALAHRGKPGPITRRLKSEFRSYVDRHTERT